MLSEAQQQELRAGARLFGLDLDDRCVERLSRFAGLLEDANREFNLTRVAPEDTVARHYLDSLALAAAWQPTETSALIDVGTGAGFPGIPLACAFPKARIVMLDGTRKRIDFVRKAIDELGLERAEAFQGRAEELRTDARYARRFDVAAARAVAKLGPLCAWLAPLLKPGGFIAAYKSIGAEEEAADAEQMLRGYGCTVSRIVDVSILGRDVVRKIVVVTGGTETPRSTRHTVGR